MNEVILDSDALHRTLRRLAHEIVEATQGVDGLVLVGIESGGAVIARRLADEIEQFEGRRPASGNLDITLHRDDLRRRGFAEAPRPTQLPDIDGLDLVEMLAPQVMQANVDPTRSGSTRSLSNVDRNERSGIFIVADDYCLEDEQRALSCGVAGYLVRPVTMDVISTMRDPAANVA